MYEDRKLPPCLSVNDPIIISEFVFSASAYEDKLKRQQDQSFPFPNTASNNYIQGLGHIGQYAEHHILPR